MEFDINIVAVIVAALANFIIGMLWYSPILFGNIWMKEMKISKEDIEKAKKKGMAKEMALGLVIAFVMAYVLAHFLAVGEVAEAGSALMVTFLIWLGFFAAPMLDTVLWEKKTVKLWVIGIGYRLAGLAAMAAIITLWP